MASLRFNTKDLIIVSSVKIRNRITLGANLVVATGASLVMLPKRLIARLGIIIDSSKSIQTSTVSRVEVVPRIVIPEIIWLDQSVKNVPAIVKDLPPETGVDGLLGLSFLKHFHLEIDFRKGLLSLE